MNIIEAIDHPQLFGPHFQGPSWNPWRVALKGLFSLPMDDDEAAVFRHHTGREMLPRQQFTEAAWVVGRRGGKSRILATIADFLATSKDYTPYLAPGEVATVAVIAADRRQARQILRYAIGLLRSVPTLEAMITAETAESIELAGQRVVIEITTASFRLTRGYTFAAVLADELAFWRSDDSANPDSEIIAGIRPGLATIPGAMLLMCSSPYAKRGELWKTFKKHFGHDNARVLVWRGTTAEMNPSIDPAIISEAYEEDPASAAAEYGAEFRNDVEAFIAREVVDAAVVPGRHELPRQPGVSYFGAVDPSGGSADSMTAAVCHKDKDRIIVDAIRERRPPFSPDDVTQEFAELFKGYGLTKCTGDRYGGEWPRERFRVHGITYELAEKPASDLYRDCLPLLNAGRVELLDHPRLAAQLCNLERRTSRAGKDSISHPPGGHDDVVNAVASAIVHLTDKRAPLVITNDILAASRRPGPATSRSLGRGITMRNADRQRATIGRFFQQ